MSFKGILNSKGKSKTFVKRRPVSMNFSAKLFTSYNSGFRKNYSPELWSYPVKHIVVREIL